MVFNRLYVLPIRDTSLFKRNKTHLVGNPLRNAMININKIVALVVIGNYVKHDEFGYFFIDEYRNKPNTNESAFVLHA